MSGFIGGNCAVDSKPRHELVRVLVTLLVLATAAAPVFGEPSASGTARGSVPTLGRPWGPGQAGYGEVRPATIDNGGDPTGVVTNIDWRTWGGPRAIGFGRNDYVAPGVDVADGIQEVATVVAFAKGDCDGRLAYRAIEWFFPQYGEHFESRSYINICAGTYADGSNTIVSPVGQWGGSVLRVTSASIGAAKLGMTLVALENAVGYRFEMGGEGTGSLNDGLIIPVNEMLTSSNVAGLDDLSALMTKGHVTCLQAMRPVLGSVHQIVQTTRGFRLGESVAELKRAYGSALRSLGPGVDLYGGYLVKEQRGNLQFSTVDVQEDVLSVHVGNGAGC